MKFMFSAVYRVTQKGFMSLRTLCTGEKFERYLADLRQRIIEAVELITPHMLINTWQEQYRLGICRATTGAHIEVYGCA